jgi:DnaJ-class molecular chaperone
MITRTSGLSSLLLNIKTFSEVNSKMQKDLEAVDYGAVFVVVRCPRCDGEGEDSGRECNTCDGTGMVLELKAWLPVLRIKEGEHEER